MAKKIVVFVIVTAAVAIIFLWQRGRIRDLRAERDRWRANTEVLMTEAEQYAVRDSLSAAKVDALELSIRDWKRWRADDAELIRELRLRVKDLETINKTQTETIIALRAIPKDTIIIRDSVPIPAIRVHCGDRWFDFDGLLTDDDFAGALAVRDSLVLTESVEFRRFLGFLWRTRRVKSRQLDVVSICPYTNVLGIEYVKIEK